ncbi:hypothetical protein CPC08DRAFT_619246, partial [Agrocybe pediades]
MSLVAWITRYVLHIAYVITYVDDISGFNKLGDLLFYAPYGLWLPADQTRVLMLWDRLGIPHKLKKQLSGLTLPVIGIIVDPNKMCFTLLDTKKSDLIQALESWTVKKLNNKPTAFKMKYWSQISGWMNWAFNVFPNLRPALNNVYKKMNGPWNPHKSIKVNDSIRDDFRWAIKHLANSPGILLIKSKHWSVDDATHTIYCDACPTG